MVQRSELKAAAAVTAMLVVFISVLLDVAAGQSSGGCVFNTTHCTCNTAIPNTGLCTRYSLGTALSATCLVDNCKAMSAGCSCDGNALCSVNKCDSWQADDPSSLALGNLVPCKFVDKAVTGAATCVTPPTPKAAGETCETGVDLCTTGYVCGCGGVCRKEVSWDVSMAGDDSVEVYVCGRLLGSTPGLSLSGKYSYSGGCDDVMVRVNNFGGEIGAYVLVEDTMSGQEYGTLASGGTAIRADAIGIASPASGWFNNPIGFDYSGWSPVIEQTSFAGVVPSLFANFAAMEAKGLKPMTTAIGYQSAGEFGFKLDMLSYC